ncbi:alpha/beta fold hydrolase [Thalassomonas viridans]|uniref:Alpha/beta fold hydrolase n=1 Tax=Thalassomonas viridans TaxID=137584 RepID=A0AAE9Z302_9GAMM|nr:alpha/beta fold hydrolase [Thalassomonas viridans]WDE05120.1 alpha/beta fold hydrolase [Thalassomonas viridans]
MFAIFHGIFNRVLFCLVLLLTNHAFAAAQVAANEDGADKEGNCLAINQDYTGIEQRIADGRYRYARPVPEGQLPEFSYQDEAGFDLYLKYAAKLIEAGNPRAKRPCPVFTETYSLLAAQNNWPGTPEVSRLVAPFELRQDKPGKAILLIHGLTDSPFMFHDLAHFYYQQGFTVRTLLLPGHGTAASDLLDVELGQWQQAADYGISRMLTDFDQVYLGGFSTGGALILDYLLRQNAADDRIKGVFMWSPASKAYSGLAWLAQYLDYLPMLDWLDLDADIDFAKYESFPYNAAAQVNRLMQHLAKTTPANKSKLKNIPLFVVASEHDRTIDTRATLDIIGWWQQGDKAEPATLMYFGDKQTAADKLPPSVTLVVPECRKNQACSHIADIAHTAPVNAPDNPHYGLTALYRNCTHYLSDPQRYRLCKTSGQVILGEKTEENLNGELPLQRLTFNPYYRQMLDLMRQFMADTASGIGK